MYLCKNFKFRVMFCSRKTPYIEVNDSIIERVKKQSIKDKQMQHIVDTVFLLSLNGVVKLHEIQLELLRCGFKIEFIVLKEVMIRLAMQGLINVDFDKL